MIWLAESMRKCKLGRQRVETEIDWQINGNENQKNATQLKIAKDLRADRE
jgi:hypothetical protein